MKGAGDNPFCTNSVPGKNQENGFKNSVDENCQWFGSCFQQTQGRATRAQLNAARERVLSTADEIQAESQFLH